MVRLSGLLLALGLAYGAAGASSAAADVVKGITIRAPRDMGYFAGDLVKADIDIVVDPGYTIDESSLPHAGPIAYWLDLRTIDVVAQSAGSNRRYTLKIVYQNFYDALDARPQEIPTFPVVLTDGASRVTADVPAWTIGVSPLREVAPPVKDDPKDYMRADEPATLIATRKLWERAVAAGVAALLALAILARDRVWWPFHARPSRAFGDAVRRLRMLARQAEDDGAYLDALLVLHRGLDLTHGQRVLADDLPDFLSRHPLFKPARSNLAEFFAASRVAFFKSDPRLARGAFGFDALQSTGRMLATIERTQP